MRNCALIASTTLALLLSPAASAAQEPEWIFEVPFDLQTLHQDVHTVSLACQTADHSYASGMVWFPTPSIGSGFVDIQLDANGSANGVATVEVNARSDRDPGQATHYACMLVLNNEHSLPDPSKPEMMLQPKSGTDFVAVVSGALP